MRVKSRGVALVAVLFGLVAVLVLTATLFFCWFIDAQATSNGSAGEEALYVAEAGVQHLWSILEPAADFARELGWPGGEPPFGAIVWFPEPPRTYRVRVAARSGGKLAVLSQGSSHRGTRRTVEAIFRRDSRWRPPAGVTFAPGTSLTDLSGEFDISGAGTDPEVPAVGAEERAEAVALRRAGGAGAAAAIVGSSGLAQALGALRDGADLVLDGPQDGGAWGSAANPLITRLSGDAELAGEIFAGGVVIGDAPLRIRGRLEIDGLLLAPNGIEITGELTVHGAVWIGTELRIASSAKLTIADSSPGLDAANIAARDVLPRPALLEAWREVW